MIRLYLDAEQTEDLARVLQVASMRLADNAELATPLANRDGFSLEAALTPTYGEPSMVRDAVRVRVAVNGKGWVYSLDEQDERRSCSGGWMGSCIPPGRLRRFFLAWIEQTDPYLAKQIALF